MAILQEAIDKGLTVEQACAVVGLRERRYRHWRDLAERGMYERRRNLPRYALTTPCCLKRRP